MPIQITLRANNLNQILTRLQRKLSDLTPAMRDIGEALSETTKQRFRSSTSPAGKPWAPNADSTLLRYLERKGGLSKKRTATGGRTLTQKGARALGSKKPLVDSKTLGTTIFYQAGRHRVEIASPMEYAAVQQFGARKGAFGRTSRGAPIPWGNIPARPFMGISRPDRATVLAIVSEWIAR